MGEYEVDLEEIVLALRGIEGRVEALERLLLNLFLDKHQSMAHVGLFDDDHLHVYLIAHNGKKSQAACERIAEELVAIRYISEICVSVSIIGKSFNNI